MSIAAKLYEYEQFRDNQAEAICFHTENNSFMPHFHSSIELMFIRGGEMRAIIDGTSIRAVENQMILVPSFSIHTFMTPERSSSTALIIPMEYLGAHEKQFQENAFSEYLLRDPVCAGRIRAVMVELADRWYQSSPILRRGMVYEVLGRLLEQVPMKKAPRGDARGRLQSILVYLQDNFTQPLTLESVAAKFGYSKSRFSHLFNETAGCSLPHYLNMLRVKHAIRLVQEEQCSMLDAAVASGYESMRSFYRAFRQIYGCTPSEYLARG